MCISTTSQNGPRFLWRFFTTPLCSLISSSNSPLQRSQPFLLRFSRLLFPSVPPTNISLAALSPHQEFFRILSIEQWMSIKFHNLLVSSSLLVVMHPFPSIHSFEHHPYISNSCCLALFSTQLTAICHCRF